LGFDPYPVINPHSGFENMPVISDKKINRRVAFRIYERVNLFYHKINPAEVLAPIDDYRDMLTTHIKPDSLGIDRLPISQSQENDALNVNISSTGMAFTCKEELQVGEYLMVRILLLSSMTVVMTCCQVVYRKPSNPYETDRYPYLIGTQFVNLTAEDTEILNKHVVRHKKQQAISYSLLLSLVLTVLAAPHMVFSFLLGLFHHLLVIILHILHLGFEFVEYNLDHFIEHTFHTELHTTQVIAFYTLLTLGIGILYLLWRVVPPAIQRLYKNQIAFWIRKKASVLYYWHGQTFADKIKIVGISAIAIAGYVYLGM
jgi:hypothetical protein